MKQTNFLLTRSKTTVHLATLVKNLDVVHKSNTKAAKGTKLDVVDSPPPRRAMKRKGSLFEPTIEAQHGEDGIIETLDEDLAAINEIVATINR